MKILPFVLNALPVVSSYLTKKEEPTLNRGIVNFIAFSFLFCAYIFASIGIYQLFKTLWGETEALFLLCGIFFLTSLLLLIVGWVLKPKKKLDLQNSTALLEKTLNQITAPESLNNKFSGLSPIPLLALFAFASIAAYFSNSKQKNT